MTEKCREQAQRDMNARARRETEGISWTDTTGRDDQRETITLLVMRCVPDSSTIR
jgi:hypothetical protein